MAQASNGNANVSWLASFIWGIADDVLRDVYVRGKYRDVILPFTVLRRLDAVLEATKDDAGAFVDEAKLNMDTGFRNISNDLAFSLFASGTGSRGVVGTISAAAGVLTINLADAQSIVQFEVGMTLVGTLTDGGAPVAVDTMIISTVDRTNGIITGSYTGTPATDWVPGTYLVVQGDIPASGASGTGSFLKVSGLAAWLPKVAPGALDSFWNVVVSVWSLNANSREVVKRWREGLDVEVWLSNTLIFVLKHLFPSCHQRG